VVSLGLDLLLVCRHLDVRDEKIPSPSPRFVAAYQSSSTSARSRLGRELDEGKGKRKKEKKKKNPSGFQVLLHAKEIKA